MQVPNPKLGIFNNGLASAKTSTGDKSSRRRSRALKDIAFNEQHFYKVTEDNELTDDEVLCDTVKRTHISSDTSSSQVAGMITNTSKFFGGRGDASQPNQDPNEDDSDDMHSAHSLQLRRADKSANANRPITPSLNCQDHIEDSSDLERREHRRENLHRRPKDAGKRREEPAPEYFNGYFEQDGPFRPVNAWRSEEARRTKMELERKVTAPTISTEVPSPPASPIRLHRTEQDTSHSSPLRRFMTMMDLDRILAAPSSDAPEPPLATTRHAEHGDAGSNRHSCTDEVGMYAAVDDDTMRVTATMDEEDFMEDDSATRMEDRANVSASRNPTLHSSLESSALEGFWRPFRP